MTASRNDSPVVSFSATTDDGETRVQGFSTTETTLNTRLGMLYYKEADLCCITVTDMNNGDGTHIFLTTASLKDLIGQFSEMVETVKEGV